MKGTYRNNHGYYQVIGRLAKFSLMQDMSACCFVRVELIEEGWKK